MPASRFVTVATAVVALGITAACGTGKAPAVQSQLRMTISATTPDGGAPDRAKLERARGLLERRFVAAGLDDVTIVTEGDRELVATVAAAGAFDAQTEQLRRLVAPSTLRMRKVLNSAPDDGSGANTTSGLPPGTTAVIPSQVAEMAPDVQFGAPAVTCLLLDSRPPGATQDVNARVVACGKEGNQSVKYLLDSAKVVGEDIADATYRNNAQSGGWIVELSFTSGGRDKWTSLTREAYDNGAAHQVAIVLDNGVLAAPSIRAVITGNAVIAGAFSKDEVRILAAQLKYGALPLTLSLQSVEATG